VPEHDSPQVGESLVRRPPLVGEWSLVCIGGAQADLVDISSGLPRILDNGPPCRGSPALLGWGSVAVERRSS
jgi:hypothetical protein